MDDETLKKLKLDIERIEMQKELIKRFEERLGLKAHTDETS
ncbi:MAG: hypothetical protein ACE5PM_03085 [Candidatus Hydrothermarchaeales archaeon]